MSTAKLLASALSLTLLFFTTPSAFAEDSIGYFNKGLALATQGDQRGSIEFYTKAIEADPSNGKAYGYRAYAYYKLLDNAHAMADAKKAIELGYDQSFVRMAKGAALYNSDHLYDAITELDAAIKLDPKEYAAYSWRGLAKVSLGRFADALVDSNKAVSLQPGDVDAYAQRADLLELIGDKLQLKADYTTIRALKSTSGDNPVLAVALIGTGAPIEAVAMCDRLLGRGKDSYVSFVKGRALLELKQYEQAIPYFDEYIATKPTFARAHLYKGQCLRALHRNDEAVRSFKAAVAAVPNFAEAQLLLAQALFDKSDYGQALAHATEAIASGENLDAYKLRSKIYEKLGQPELARADNLKANPTSAKTSGAADVNQPIDDKWAVVIGISKFANSKINLKCPAQDAQDFYNFLVGKAGFAKDHVKLLLDQDATRSQILSDIGDKWLPRLARPNDLVVIYVSTHGSPAEVDIGNVNYLVAFDTDIDSLYATGIPLQDLTRIIKKRIMANRIVLILDACHSGAADAQAKGLFRPSNVDAVEVSQGTGQLVLSSSAQDQQAWESKQGPNSVFTKRLLEGLQTKGATTSLADCFEYLREKVIDDVQRERGKLQTPIMKSEWNGSAAVLSAKPMKPRPGLP